MNEQSDGSSEQSNLQGNPFTALFPSVTDAIQYALQVKTSESNTIQTTMEYPSETVVSSQRVTTQAGMGADETVQGVMESTDKLEINSELEGSDDQEDLFDLKWILNNLLQRIFLIGLKAEQHAKDYRYKRNKFDEEFGGPPQVFVFLQNINSNDMLQHLNWDNLELALQKRLTLTSKDLEKNIIAPDQVDVPADPLNPVEKSVIHYLEACYRRQFAEEKKFQDKHDLMLHYLSQCEKLIVAYFRKCLAQPKLFPGGQCNLEFRDLLFAKLYDPVFMKLYHLVVTDVDPHCGETERIFENFINPVAEKIVATPLVFMEAEVAVSLKILVEISKSTNAVEYLVETPPWIPPYQIVNVDLFHSISALPSGVSFETHCVLGKFLALSSIPRHSTNIANFFVNPSRQSPSEMNSITSLLRDHIKINCDQLKTIFSNLLKSKGVAKHGLLHVIGFCLYANRDRNKMASNRAMLAGDGFFLNLGIVLLSLCEPFLAPQSLTLMKVDPRYAVAQATVDSIAEDETTVHLPGLQGSTKLCPPESQEEVQPTAIPEFGFTTELFFITHKTLELGWVTICNAYLQLMQRLSKLQALYEESRNQPLDHAIAGSIGKEFELRIAEQLSIKCHLFHPMLAEPALKFCIVTASWLVQVLLAQDGFGALKYTDPSLAQQYETAMGLRYIPEFVVNNIVDIVLHLRRFNEETLETAGEDLRYLINFSAIFLSKPKAIKNPHLRAKIIDVLTALLPVRPAEEAAGNQSFVAMHFRSQAFVKSELAARYLGPALLSIFCDIEKGDYFEQKFGLRHRMYSVLEYIWSLQQYQSSIVEISKKADDADISSDPPLFLRFINLLVNDSTYLLDEAIQHLKTVKNLEMERDRGDWESLETHHDQMQKKRELETAINTARTHNVLANETIKTIAYLTKEIKRPFRSSAMATRIAGTLNYFLVRLVTKKQMKALKVKDFDSISFKPQQLLFDIVTIYLNLAENDGENIFCEAISQDDRSYSDLLFDEAEQVLRKIRTDSDIVDKWRALAEKIEVLIKRQREVEEALPEAPEEFLDSIMCTLMSDPVRLPSGHIVDKAVILRHILSDPIDPFSRAPLTVDMLQPLPELKQRIQRWVKEKMKIRTDTDM